MGGVKSILYYTFAWFVKKLAQNYKKTSTYAIRTRIFLRKLPFSGPFFTQTTLKGVNFSTCVKKTHPRMRF